MLLRFKLILYFIILWGSQSIFAQQFSVGWGYFMVDAQVGSNSANISNLGAYKMEYLTNFTEKFKLAISYNLIMEDIYSGDKSFGPSIGFKYYPLRNNTVYKSQIDGVSLTDILHINPFVHLGFSQRQYQSIESTYSGFLIGGGIETGWTDNIALWSELQISLLEGPNQGSATETLILFGISYFP